MLLGLREINIVLLTSRRPNLTVDRLYRHKSFIITNINSKLTVNQVNAPSRSPLRGGRDAEDL